MQNCNNTKINKKVFILNILVVTFNLPFYSVTEKSFYYEFIFKKFLLAKQKLLNFSYRQYTFYDLLIREHCSDALFASIFDSNFNCKESGFRLSIFHLSCYCKVV